MSTLLSDQELRATASCLPDHVPVLEGRLRATRLVGLTANFGFVVLGHKSVTMGTNMDTRT